MTHQKIVFALQGGGALGAYQVGVLDALLRVYEPSWITGTSIGAINASIVAGNEPHARLEKLQGFWRKITTEHLLTDDLVLAKVDRKSFNFFSSLKTFISGQNGFFKPKWMHPFYMRNSTPDKISFYDFSILESTLREFVDFDLLNSGKMRLSVGAVQVDTGKQVYFDNTLPHIPVGSNVHIQKCKIEPKHIMASCALPPGFPAVKIHNHYYWDGGIYCNTPISIVLDSLPKAKTLCFMLQLFDSYGTEPTNFDDVMKRHKDIVYSSNHRSLLQAHRMVYTLRNTIYELYQLIPHTIKIKNQFILDNIASSPEPTIDVVRLHYKGKDSQWSHKDAEFSQLSIQEHINEGMQDTLYALQESPWKQPIPQHVGIVIHDIARDNLLKTFLSECGPS